MSTTARAAKPLTPAQAYAQSQQQQGLLRTGIALLLVLLLALPHIPSSIAGVNWWQAVVRFGGPSLGMLDTVPLSTGPVWLHVSILQWLVWLFALLLFLLALTLLQHLGALYAQRTRPLTLSRTYLRLRVPLTRSVKPTEGMSLLGVLHGIAPAVSPIQGGSAPFVLHWTGRPEVAVMQGMSVQGSPTIIAAVQNTLKGISRGTQAVVADDPLQAACTPARLLGWCDARLTAPSDLPIAPADSSSGVLDALLPALSPQAGIAATDVQLILMPLADRTWRAAVRARLDSMKADSANAERRALEAKSAGPAFAVTLRLLAVGDTLQAVSAQLATMSAALAGSAQAVGSVQQRLVAGPTTVLPAVLDAPASLSRRMRVVFLVASVLVALAVAVLLWRTSGAPVRWALAPLIGLVPLLSGAALHRRRGRAAEAARLREVQASVPPPRNPRCVPLWWPWLGHTE